MSNVLLTAIGSMSADAVIDSLQKAGYNVFGTDIHPAKWIGAEYLVGDKFFQVPLASSEKYIPELVKICKENDIQYLQPLTDLEVDVLVENRNVFESIGIILCVAATKCVQICRNKLKLAKFFQGDGQVTCIPSYTRDEIQKLSPDGKIVAKIINGRSSEGLFVLEGLRFVDLVPDNGQYLYQPYMAGDIFGVDVVRDIHGNSCVISRQEFLRTANNAAITAELKYNQNIIHLTNYIANQLNILGSMHLEYIFNGKNYYLMDVNPRFAASVGFNLLVGYDMVVNHIKCFQGKEIDGQIFYGRKIVCKRFIILNK